jgi:replication factor A1
VFGENEAIVCGCHGWCLTLACRVSKKTPVKHFRTARGEGKLFSVELLDEETEIRATFFGIAVDNFFEVIHEGGTYLMSGGSVKAANKQYTSINNPYEITFGDSTNVV